MNLNYFFNRFLYTFLVLTLGMTHWCFSYQHALLISIDGMHAQDLLWWIQRHPQSQLAHWVQQGTLYTHANTTVPTDSFPGLEALISGVDPKFSGLWYDVSWDRSLAPPGSHCNSVGTTVALDETLDDHQGQINPDRLPLDPDHHCSPVWPHQYVQVNNIFSVAHAHHKYTAWVDKHPAYEFVTGADGHAVDDLYTPEIGANFEGKIHNDHQITGHLRTTEAYDQQKMQALFFELSGKTHDGTAQAPVPVLLGLNLQSLNVAQKLYGYNRHAQPSKEVEQSLRFCDQQLQQLQHTLHQQHLQHQTLIVLTAKHGNSPIPSNRVRHIDKHLLSLIIQQAVPGALAHITADDAALIWLHHPEDATAVQRALMQHAPQLGIRAVQSLHPANMQGLQQRRTPDLIVRSAYGVIYGDPGTHKKAEHGGYSADDHHVALLLVDGKHRIIQRNVSTRQIAPTLLKMLGLPWKELNSWSLQHTVPLPGT